MTELNDLTQHDDDEPEPKWIVLLKHELKPSQCDLLAELIVALKRETGFGVISLHMRDKSVQTITVEKSYKV